MQPDHSHQGDPPHSDAQNHDNAAHHHDAGEHHRHGEDYAARKHPEFVVLDIGGDAGALIVHTDAAMHGVEIEISREGEPRDGSHKQVLERSAGGQPQFTAVFDGLPAGGYALWTGEDPRARDVKIEGGRITELDWRTR
jgi:hypothetical protein